MQTILEAEFLSLEPKLICLLVNRAFSSERIIK